MKFTFSYGGYINSFTGDVYTVRGVNIFINSNGKQMDNMNFSSNQLKRFSALNETRWIT